LHLQCTSGRTATIVNAASWTMSAPAAIQRIGKISPEEFQRDYANKRAPVIIQSLFAGKPIAAINTLELALEALRDLELVLTDEFSSLIARELAGVLPSASDEPDIGDICNFSEYLKFIAAYPNTRKTVTVNQSPAQLLELAGIPSYCGSSASSVISKFFLGKAGNFAHVHFDTDARDVLLYQVFGNKHAVLLPANEAGKLAPIANYGTVRFEHYTEQERRAFFERANAYECILSPGETLYIPKLMWHYIGYLDINMSINFRFAARPNRYLQFLVDHIHRNYFWQNIAVMFSDQEEVRKKHLHEFICLAYQHFLPSGSREERFRRMQKALKEIYLRMCPAKGEPAVSPELEEFELKLFPAPHSYCIFPGQFQTGPISNPNRAVSGPADPVQLRVIESWCARSGHHAPALHLASERLFEGRSYHELSKQEARVLIHALMAA
jgi:hypothetical protein